MSDPADNGKDVRSVPVPTLTITFDPRTYQVAVGGSAPTWEFAEGMLHMALKEAGRRINERRAEKRIALAGPELFSQLKAHEMP